MISTNYYAHGDIYRFNKNKVVIYYATMIKARLLYQAQLSVAVGCRHDNGGSRDTSANSSA